MERVILDMTLDLTESHSNRAVTVKRGDTHRTLKIHLSDGGRPYRMLPECQAVFTAVKPDGSHLFNGCRVEGQTVVYDLTPQTTALPGELACELRLYGADGALLTTAAFWMTVADTVYADGDEQIASTGEATALTKLMADAAQKLTQMDVALKNEANHATIDDETVGTDAWSSKQIADALCPGIDMEESVVECTPLTGYPMTVVSTIGRKADGTDWQQITMTRCGKNLFDFKQPVYAVTYAAGSGQGTRMGYSLVLPAGTYTMHAEPVGTVKDQYIYCVLNDLMGNPITAEGFGHLKQGTRYWTRTFTLGEPAVLFVYDGISHHTQKDAQPIFSNDHNVQLETGTVATPYAPFAGQTLRADLTDCPVSEGSYNWNTGVLINDSGEMYQHRLEDNTFDHIGTIGDPYAPPVLRKLPALPGVNYIYSDCGSTAVTGRADPVTFVEKRLSALEAAVIKEV